MSMVFVVEARFLKTKNGLIYAHDHNFSRKLWERYLTVFPSLIVIARVKEFQREETKYLNENYLASHSQVTFIEIPYYIGPSQFLKNIFKIVKVIKGEIIEGRSYLFRLPGILGNIAALICCIKNFKYSVEVVGDPQMVFSKHGGIRHPLRPFLEILSPLSLKQSVRRAAGVLYVTKKELQIKYPANNKAFTATASNVMISEEFYTKKHRTFLDKEKYTLISIGTLEQMYKSPDVVISALGLLKSQGLNIELIWLGEGRNMEQMKDMAKKKNVIVHFLGNVSYVKVREYLLLSDLFVLASRTEGLPRAMIEAMALALPCIGTDIGGIPELLNKECLVEVNNPNQLAKCIFKLLTSPSFYEKESKENFRKSKEYKNESLQEIRELFYEKTLNN